MSAPDIRPISAAETREIRHTVLRPTQPADELVYPGDDDDDALHVGAFVDGRLVGIASVYRQPRDGRPDPGAWRLRGMAVLPEHRGGRLGETLFRATVEHAKSQGGTSYWCNARSTAAGFYTRLGMAQEGPEFELPRIGPHVVMVMAI